MNSRPTPIVLIGIAFCSTTTESLEKPGRPLSAKNTGLHVKNVCHIISTPTLGGREAKESFP